MKNKAMFNSLAIVFFIAFAAGAELFDELNSTMQLVPFPQEFKIKLLTTMSLDFGVAWLCEFVTWSLFSNNKPQKSLFPSKSRKIKDE